MKGFSGFPSGRQSNTPVPDLFFSEVLPNVDNLAELKVTLHIFWMLARRGGSRRCVSGGELSTDSRLLDGIAVPGQAPEETLGDALDRAVARHTLLRVTAGEDSERKDWYFANTQKGREAVDDFLAGTWAPDDADESLHLQAQRPNVFVLYEQNIGPLTPLLAEELMEAEDTYPAMWIEDAFREAVELNKRSWRYVQRILERWAAEGKDDETSRRVDKRDRHRFIEGEYAEYIEH
jgi:DnaD/phage-associated family protein